MTRSLPISLSTLSGAAERAAVDGRPGGYISQARGSQDAAFLSEGLACFFISLLLPVLFYIAGVASLQRYMYPALAAVGAGVLYARNSPWYFGLCTWLFCATPLVRRLIDEQAGWDPSNPALLTPYLASAFAGLGALSYLTRKAWVPRTSGPFVVIIGCISYGLMLALSDGRELSGLIEAMKWSAGPLVALYLISYRRLEAAHEVVVISLLVAVPMMAAYGIVQYINPPPWDADWMENVKTLGLDSIGQPRPFAVRVFSTMNSPGSFAAIMMFGILVAMKRNFSIMIPTVSIALLGLLLTEYRAVWAGTCIGALLLVLIDRCGLGTRVLAISIIFAGALIATSAIPEMRGALSDRLDSLTHLDSDASGEDRLLQYQRFFSGDNGNMVSGEGLALDGASRRLDNKSAVVIDSGIIEIFSTFGIFVGSLFFSALASAISLTFLRELSSFGGIYCAGAVGLFCQVPFGSVFIGESGYCGWLFLGLAAASVQKRRDVAAASSRDSVPSPPARRLP